MTVCIGAFAEKSKAIVMVSDKAITYGGAEPMQWDTNAKKVRRVGNTFWYALIAGDPTFALNTLTACEAILSQVDGQGLEKTAQGMQRAMKTAYQKCRRQSVSDMILAPRLLTPELFVSRPTTLQPLHRKFFTEVSDLAASLKTDTSLLVCGFDDQNEAHLFSVSGPGKIRIHDLAGFDAIGIGRRTALSRLLVLDADPKNSLGVALYQAFDAKALAEVNQGVGYNWDAEVLVPGAPAITVPPSIVRLLERVYESHPFIPFEVVKKRAKKPPPKWEKKLQVFVQKSMAKTKPSKRSKAKGG